MLDQQTPSWCGPRRPMFPIAIAVTMLALAAVAHGDEAASWAENGNKVPLVDLIKLQFATDAPVAAEAAPDSPAGEPEPPPSSPPRIRHPQPSLRHATPRYEATYAVPAADAALLRRLEEPLPEGGIRLPENATLLDLEDWLSQRAKMRVRIDWRALEDAGREAETPLETTRVDGGDLRAALRTLLDDVDLATIVAHGTLLVTTAEAAEESLTVGFYPLPSQLDQGNVQPLVEMIQATVAADTWDVVGGPGAIRVAEEANALAISHTEAVHAEILAFMRTGFDADLATDADRQAGQTPIRVHRVRDVPLATEIAATLVTLCNQALGPAGDPAAAVTRIGGDRLVVQSASRPFQVYAAEVIRAVNGVEGEAIVPAGMAMPEGGMGNPFCWVAREVYGPTNPRWLAFRGWMLSEAPAWLRAWYGTHGQVLAAWLRDRPLAKSAVRALLDAAITRR